MNSPYRFTKSLTQNVNPRARVWFKWVLNLLYTSKSIIFFRFLIFLMYWMLYAHWGIIIRFEGQYIKDGKRLRTCKFCVSRFFCFLFFSVRLLSVLRGHSVFSSPPQQPMISDFEGFSIPDLIHYINFLSYFLRKYFPFLMLSVKQGNYLYHFYTVFGMTRFLTGDWTRDLLHSKPALYH